MQASVELLLGQEQQKKPKKRRKGTSADQTEAVLVTDVVLVPKEQVSTAHYSSFSNLLFELSI
jgi:hypothetical protein